MFHTLILPERLDGLFDVSRCPIELQTDAAVNIRVRMLDSALRRDVGQVYHSP